MLNFPQSQYIVTLSPRMGYHISCHGCVTGNTGLAILSYALFSGGTFITQ